MKLQLALKAEYFDAIRDGTKTYEYRLNTKFWRGRIVGKAFDRIILTKGYPKTSDKSKRLELPWNGFHIERITHPHFGPEPVVVLAIDVTGRF